MKKILCINYSQSGQLDEILDNFLKPFDQVEIDRIKTQPSNSFPFPWKTNNFYDPMPETVLEEPIELEPIAYKEEKYDLIVLGYQPWFLSPSMPTTALLKSEEFKKRLKDTPVCTVIGARNMWLNAHTSVVKLIEDAGGHMVGNIALTDRAPNLLSAMSIVHWMMTGKKERKWGILPLPGVSQEDIEASDKFGHIVKDSMDHNFAEMQSELLKNDAIRINTNILFIEGRAKKIFNIWAKIIKKKEAEGKKRSTWIKIFRVYLNVALFGLSPIILVIYNLLIRPFTGGLIKKQKDHFYYLGIKQ